MTIGEKLYFIRQLRSSFESIGALIPTSGYAAQAMAAEVARRRGPKTVLEVGAGTGAITAEIIKHIGPGDTFVVCEINPDFVAYLKERFEREPEFRRVRDHVRIHGASVTELEGSQVFDCIVSAVPFTSLPPELTEAILERYRELLKPGGTLTYIEYAYFRALKHRFASAVARVQADAVNAILDRVIALHQFRRDMVWRNVPPAWIRHLRLSEPKASDAQSLAPLEQAHQVSLGGFTIAADALPFLAGLGSLEVGLRILNRVTTPKPQSSKPKARIRMTLSLVAAGGLIGFFRDPPRRITPDSEAVYAACDGRVLSVERVCDPRFGPGEWLRIAVFLSLLDVHINRAPIAGKVVQILRESGGYAAADRTEAEHNLAEYTVIEGIHGRCVVAQRVGLVARRIVNWSNTRTLLAQGERFGLIRFGSRTDVYLPAHRVQAMVAVGERVRAGETVIARYCES